MSKEPIAGSLAVVLLVDTCLKINVDLDFSININGLATRDANVEIMLFS